MSDEATQQEAAVANSEAPVVADEVQEVKTFDESYVKKLRDEAASYRVKLKEFEDRDKSDAERAAERVAELENQNAVFKREAERGGWLRDASKETGLPMDALEVIQGESYEDILSGANRIKSFIPEQKTVIPGDVERDALPLNGDGIESALRKALGG